MIFATRPRYNFRCRAHLMPTVGYRFPILLFVQAHNGAFCHDTTLRMALSRQ